ncbi:hypothetical protein B0H17DRAFT_1052329 [Mycena rosella]|uniref:Uncharacterized protein n=1 Tax=Mycena rosella TaxID=1033263 RepID=A0AAD7DQ97_MYCRO|nr:hypothetical protein B0H17DRAFT_1052329 [Mycena rosella]
MSLPSSVDAASPPAHIQPISSARRCDATGSAGEHTRAGEFSVVRAGLLILASGSITEFASRYA